MAGKRKSVDGTGSAGKKRPAAAQAEAAEPETKKPVAKRSDEEDFPRGGASALTRAEIREAREEADAEFEKEKGQTKRKKGKKDKKGDAAGEDDGFHGSILSGKLQGSAEFLRYKSLVVGMKIWGVIAEINKKDMVISLPGGLRGFVSTEEATQVFDSTKGETKKAKKQTKKAANSESDPADLEKEVPHLSDLFSLGQLVACTVRKLEIVLEKKGHGKSEKEGKTEKKAHRIELSLRLNYLYDGLSIDAVHEDQALSAVVTSIEDHGYLLSFGVTGISGFLLRSNYMDGKKTSTLRKGQLVQGVVISVDKKRGAVGLKANPGLVASNMVKEFAGLTVELLTPGAMVNARVRAVLKNGLLLSFLTYFTGTVDIFHLEDPLPGTEWKKKYVENQRLKARILYIDPVAKTVGLTLNPQLINNVAPTTGVDVGNAFQDAIVRRVDATVGMLIELPTKENSVAGYVHISNVSDEYIKKLEKKYDVGKKVRARVIGHRPMDALAIVSLKESVVEQLLLSHADVKPAMHVTGTVVSVEAYGALVQLAEGVKALCPLQQMSELQRSTPSSKFQVGAKLKFRVLTCDPEAKKIVLTHKKTMVQSKLSSIISYEDAVEGMVTHGFITGVEDIGCFVSFYNDVRGLVHKSALNLEAGVKAESVFQVGHVVKCRVLRSDPSARRLSLSFNTTPRDNASAGDLKPGKVVAGVVAHVSDSVIILDIFTKQVSVKGYLTFPHLTDNLGHIDQLKAVMKVGVQFDQLLILEVTDKQKLIVSAKHSMLQAASSLPSDISQLQPQSVIPGYVANITDIGCFVRFLGRLTGLASISQVADEFVSDPNNHFKIGQSVRAQVLEVHHDTGKFSLCLKQSVCYSTDASLIHGYFLEEEKIVESSGASKLGWTESLAIGTCTAGEVQEIKDYGVIVKIPSHDAIVGFITHYQVGDPVEVGKPVQARVLDVVKADAIVDLTLRSELVQVSNSEETKSKKKNKKRLNSATTLELHQKVAAVVELVKDTYLVLSLPEQGNAIGFAAAGDYNSQQQDSHQNYKPGQKVVATVKNLGDKDIGQRLLLLLNKSDDAAQATPRNAKKARKELKNEKDKEIGTIVDAEVVAIEKLQLIVRLVTAMEGRVHITEIMDQNEDGNPLSRFEVGQKVRGRVVQKARTVKSPSTSEHYVFELSLRPSQLSDTSEAEAGKARPGALPSIKDLSEGQVVKAYVQELKNDWAWLVVAPHLRGRLFLLDSSSDPSELGKFAERFTIGTAVSCRVKAINHEKQTLDFTLRDALPRQEETEFHVSPMEVEGSAAAAEKDQEQDVAGFQKGDILGGRVARVSPGVGGLSVQIAPTVFGRVHVTHLNDSWRDDPASAFKEGQFVRCVVLEAGKCSEGKTRIDLTLRKSLGGSEGGADIAGSSNAVKIESMSDLKKDLEVQGFVKSTSVTGCFVSLAPKVDARVLISNLANTFVKEPAESFPPGKLVTGRILSVVPASGRVEMSLKKPNEKKKAAPTSNLLGRRFGDFKEGEVVFGLIKRIEKFGMFVTIEQSSVVGMCHVSEVADHYVKDVDKHYKVGDRVRARVIKVDTSNERISLGLKESYFAETEKPVSEDVAMEVTNEQETNMTSVDDAEESDEDDDEDLEEMVDVQREKSDDEESDVESEEETGVDLDNLDEDDEGESESEDDVPKAAAATFVAPALEVNLEDSQPRNDVEEEEDEESEDAKKVTKRAKKRQKEKREAEIAAAEEKRLKGDQAPETVDEFEALVRTSPNSSLVWIKYMAFLVQLADVDKARAVAERALQTINYREEGEKLNVWIAYLNLENVYGNPPKEAVLTLFNKGLQYNDPKKLYFALLGIYENSRQPQGPQHDMVDQLLKTMTKKFNTSAKVWLRQIQSLLARDMGDAAHKALDQSLLSLPRRKHIKVISRAALLEFKTGSVERARSIFEGILRNYPKRVDLWSVYLDQEIRVGEVPVIRALFERVICLELPPRKMKFLFKKYLDYEKAHGDDEHIEHVKKKAMEYVDAKLG